MAKHDPEKKGGTHAFVPATFRVNALERERDSVDFKVLDRQEEK